jgi:hypothetical protein
MRRVGWGGIAIAGGLLAACGPNWAVGVGAPAPGQNPLITRFEVYLNPQTPGKGPFEIVAVASGQGTLSFHWWSTGGLLSVASASLPAATGSLAPSYTAWQPPNSLGTYSVFLTVTDSGGGSDSRVARFEVQLERTRLESPAPGTLLPPGAPWPLW